MQVHKTRISHDRLDRRAILARRDDADRAVRSPSFRLLRRHSAPGIPNCRSRRRRHSTLSTCAQIATMPKNNAKEAKAAASSTTARTMSPSHEQRKNIVPILFFCQGGVVGQFDYGLG